MRSLVALVSLSVAFLTVSADTRAAGEATSRVVLFADRDDDDADGTPDGEQAIVAPSSELYRVAIPTGPAASAPVVVRGASVRVLADGRPVSSGRPVPPHTKRVELQATGAGRAEIEIFGRTLAVSALALFAFDGEGREVDLARSHASLQRTPPARLPDGALGDPGDPDALRFVVAGAADDVPASLRVFSYAPDATPIDALPELPLTTAPCPASAGKDVLCASSLPVRAVADDIDRRHPLVKERSIQAQLGGAIAVVSPAGEPLQMIRVAGPRRSPLGPIERFRASLHVFLVRLGPHGPPPLGGDDAGALEVARAEVERAAGLWGACGIGFGPPSELDVRVVDPPPPHLVALGCDHGLPASGGAVRLRVDGRAIQAPIAAGMKPAAAARAVASAIHAAGFTAVVSDNPVIGAGAFGSSDVLVRKKSGALASIDAPASGPLSSDATMTACLGRVDMEDGLQHFGDVDAIAGTVEERALIKAFDDGDPGTVEIFLVPSFAGGGRIGESFIYADGGAVRNVLIEDRAGIRADRASFALAHELGHILLDDPGHPDDFGADTPTRLMDADAANPSAYGPRRLLVEECARALRQSGPGAPVPLLRPWPLVALGREVGRPAGGPPRPGSR